MTRNNGIPRPRGTTALPFPCCFLLLMLACDLISCGPGMTRGGDSPWKRIAATWRLNDRLQASPALCAAGTACRENSGYRGAGLSPDDLEPSGSIEILTADTVIEGMDITGRIEIKAPRVTVRNSRIRSTDPYPVRVFPGGSLVIEFTEVIGASSCVAAVAPGNYTARRLDVHGATDGFRAGSNVIIEGCYIHDLAMNGGSSNHGIRQLSGRNVLIRNNTIEMPPGSASAIMIATDTGPIDNVLIDGNRVNGGGYIIHSRAGRHIPPVVPTNIRINNNRLGRNFGHGLFSTGRTTTFSGNVWLDSGGPVPLPY